MFERLIKWVFEPLGKVGNGTVSSTGPTVLEIINNNKLSNNDKGLQLHFSHGLSIKEAAKFKAQEYINSIKQRSIEDITLDRNLSTDEKRVFLGVHGYSPAEADELISTAVKESNDAKLKGDKRKISQKVQEMFNDVPVHDRQPIPDDVKMYVWKRDGGACIKCNSNQNLEFDHIIPFSKGGSSTERNLQLLCEKCNREKKDTI